MQYAMNRYIFACALAVGLSGVNLLADDWTVERCIDYAIEHNIDVKMRRADVESGQLQVEAGRNAFLPQLSGNASQSFNFGRGLTAANTYANRNTSSFQVGASFSLPLFSGLRNTRTLEQAKLNLAQIVWQLEQTRDNVALNVMSQYLQVLYNREVEETAKNQLDLSQYELDRRRTLADNGKIAEVEVIEAESQLAQDRLTLVNAHNDYALAVLELTQLLQLENTDGFNVVSIDSDVPVLPSAMSVYSSALEINNTLKAADAGIDVARAGISVASTGYIPTLSLSGGIGTSYYKLNGTYNLPFKQQMRENYSTYIGFSLNVPIFDALNTRTSVRRARVQLLTATLQREQVLSDLYKTIQQAHTQAMGACSKLEAATISSDAAEISFAAISEKYNIGRATSTEYEQSKSNLFKALIQRIQARYEYLLRYRILDFYRTGFGK